MARRKTLLDVLNELKPDVRKAFFDSVNRVTSDVQIRALENAIRRGDTASVLRLIKMDSGYFAPLDQALTKAYTAGGDWAVAELKRIAQGQGVKVSHHFDVANPRAERFLRDRSSKLVVEIQDDARDAIRSTLRLAAERGTHPRNAALDLIGRINRATGRREGGVIGLTSRENQWAMSAYDELRSGNKTAMSNYLGRKARDKRFDRTVMKAMKEGRGLTQTEARQIVARYRDILLRKRGERIARTEMLESLGHAEQEGLQQLVDGGDVQQDAIKLEWDASLDSAVRPSHAAMDGQTITFGDSFTTGNGYRLKYPGDRSLGAPGEETIMCRCITKKRIDFTKGLRDRLSPEELGRARAAIGGDV